MSSHVKIKTVLIFFLAVVVGFLRGQPTIQKGPSDAHVFAGHTATFNCLADGLQDPENSDYSVAWMRNGDFITIGVKIQPHLTDQDRYSVCECGDGNYTLRVKNTNQDDAIHGFSCHIWHPNINSSCGNFCTPAKIYVTDVPLGNPQCYLSPGEASHTVKLPGDRVETTCLLRTSGRPVSTLRWFRNDRSVGGTKILEGLPDIRDEWVVHEDDNGTSIRCIYTSAFGEKSCDVSPFEVRIYNIGLTVDESRDDKLIFNCGLDGAPDLDVTYSWIVDGEGVIFQSRKDQTGLTDDQQLRYNLTDDGRRLTIENVGYGDHDKLVRCFVHGDNIKDKQAVHRIDRPPPPTTTATTTTITTQATTTHSDHLDQIVCIAPVIGLSVTTGILLAALVALVAVVICWKCRNNSRGKQDNTRSGDFVGYVNAGLVDPNKKEESNVSVTDETSLAPAVATAVPDQGDGEIHLHYDSCDVTSLTANSHGRANSAIGENGKDTVDRQQGSSRSGAYEVVNLDTMAVGGSEKAEPVLYKSLTRDVVQPSYMSLASVAKQEKNSNPKPKPKVRQKPLKLPLRLPKSFKRNKGDAGVKPKPPMRPRKDKVCEENQNNTTNTCPVNQCQPSNQVHAPNGMAAWKVMM